MWPYPYSILISKWPLLKVNIKMDIRFFVIMKVTLPILLLIKLYQFVCWSRCVSDSRIIIYAHICLWTLLHLHFLFFFFFEKNGISFVHSWFRKCRLNVNKRKKERIRWIASTILIQRKCFWSHTSDVLYVLYHSKEYGLVRRNDVVTHLNVKHVMCY